MLIDETTGMPLVKGMLVGAPLPSSPSKHEAEKTIQECKHPEYAMKARGNRTAAWWTCNMCHGRWERFSKEDAPVLPPESSVSDMKKAHCSRHAPPAPNCDTILTFGKHKGSTIRFVGTTYPKYSQWLLKTAKEQLEATTEIKQAALALRAMGIQLEEEEETPARAPSEHLLSSGAASDVTGLLSSEESDTEMREEEIREAARHAAARDPKRTR